MALRQQKSYSDLASDIDISTASFATGQEQPVSHPESSQGVSTGNHGVDSGEFSIEKGYRQDSKKASEVAFVAECIGGGSESREGVYSADFSNGIPSAYSAGAISKLLYRTLPIRKKDRIKKAYMHAERDDLLASLIETLTDFTVTGFSNQAKPPSSLKGDGDSDASYKKIEQQSTEFQNRLDQIGIAIDAKKLASDLANDWFISDSMILYWRIKDGTTYRIEEGKVIAETSVPSNEIEEAPFGIPGIVDIAVLCPADVDWDNSIGNDVLLMNIPDKLREKVNTAFTEGIKDNLTNNQIYVSLMNDGVPQRWIDAIRNHRPNVQLLKENGDNWIIRTRARNYHGLANPKMYAIFLDLEMRNILKEGDASTALMAKHFIMLIKQGESILTGPLTGSTRNYLKKAEADKLLHMISVTSRAFLMAVNHTTSIEWAFPPKEMWDGTKYVEPEKRIFNWAGVTRILSTGEGGKYSAGFIGLKRTMGKIEKAREEIASLFLRFFNHETIKKEIPTPEGYLVNSRFDSNILKEPQQLLEELKFLAEQYWVDPRTALTEMGRDPDAIKASSLKSREENDVLECWSKIMTAMEKELAEAGLDAAKNAANPDKPDSLKNKGGRPANPGTTKSAATRHQNPVARRTSNS